VASREERENAHFIGRFDEITGALAQRCHDPVVNDGYRLLFALRNRVAELESRCGERLVSAVFACREEDCPQPFALHRAEDVTGVSGNGTVAYGARFADGTVVIRWLGEHPSTVVWPSLEAAEHVHGHDGRTRFVWLAAPFSEMALAEREAAAAERERLARLLEDRAARAVPGVEREAWREAAALVREEAGRG
jgi:hypothetical protein